MVPPPHIDLRGPVLLDHVQSQQGGYGCPLSPPPLPVPWPTSRTRRLRVAWSSTWARSIWICRHESPSLPRSRVVTSLARGPALTLVFPAALPSDRAQSIPSSGVCGERTVSRQVGLQSRDSWPRYLSGPMPRSLAPRTRGTGSAVATSTAGRGRAGGRADGGSRRVLCRQRAYPPFPQLLLPTMR